MPIDLKVWNLDSSETKLWPHLWVGCTLALLALTHNSCSTDINTNINNDGSGSGIAGPPGSEPGDDLDVALPVPMALTGMSVLAENRNYLRDAGGQGSYSANEQCSQNINTMDTSLDSQNNHKNFCVSLNIMSNPGRAAGEMRRLLDEILEVRELVFGSDGVLGEEVVVVKRTITHFRVSDGSDLNQPEFAELVIVDRDKSSFRVNLYYRLSSSPLTWELRLSLEVTPKASNANLANIKLSHNHLPTDSIYREYLDATYDTETKEMSAVFGRSPVHKSYPATTKLSMSMDADADLFYIQGAYTWSNDIDVRPVSAMQPPKYYQPASNDIALFEAVTMLSGDAESVQRLVYIPQDAQGKAAATKASEQLWLLANNGYTKDLKRYIVEILRNSDVTPDCVDLTDKVRNDPNVSDSSDLASIPDNICQNQSAVNDVMVETVLTVACRHTNLILPLTLLVEGQTENFDVNLCAKWIEAYLMQNNQYIKVEANTSGALERVLQLQYTSNPNLVNQLLDWQPPAGNTNFDVIEAKLEQLPAMDFSEIVERVWPQVTVVDEESYFSTAK